jgi:hypothetical protein
VTHLSAANPHLQRWARSIVARARRNGEIVPEPCVVCGDEKAVGHHEDYAEPLNIVWLCRMHHSWRHRYEGSSVEEMVATRDDYLALRAAWLLERTAADPLISLDATSSPGRWYEDAASSETGSMFPSPNPTRLTPPSRPPWSQRHTAEPPGERVGVCRR